MNIDQIRKEGLCSGCGTCAGICPFNAIKMILNPKGIFVPVIDEAKCKKCIQPLCTRVCPGYSTNFNELNNFVFNEIPQDLLIGNSKGHYIGYSTNEKIRWDGASGGIITSLLIFALEEGLIDGALVTRMNENAPLEPEVFLARTKEQIISASASKYCPVPANVALKNILKEDGKFAVVGLPCHIEGVRKAEMLNEKLRRKIVLHIGLFCYHNVSFRATELLIEKMRIQKRNITSIRYRGKGWPGETAIALKNGKEISIKPYTKYWDCILGNYFFTPKRCTLCTDMLNELSDVSCGDAWLPELRKDKIGTSMIIARTDTGEQLLSSAKSKGKLKITKINTENIKQAQHFSLTYKKKNSGTRFVLLEHLGKSVPNIDPKPLPSGLVSFLSAILVFSGIYVSSRKSRILLKYVPFSLLRPFFWLNLTVGSKW